MKPASLAVLAWTVALNVIAWIPAAALAAADRLRSAGYPATVRAYRVAEDLRYDVNVAGLATVEDASRLESALRGAGHKTR